MGGGLGLALLGVFPHAQATTFLQRPFPETIAEAPFIVRGIVGNSHSDWSSLKDGARRIYTFTDLGISEVIRGNVPGQQLVVRELGGTKDGMGMEVSGTAQFTRGEEVVLLLGETNPDGSRDVRGMMMGKFNIQQDAKGTQFLIGPGLSEVDPEGMPGHDHSPKTGGHGDTVWSLNALRKLVREQDAAPDKSLTEQKKEDLSAVNAVPSSSEAESLPMSTGAPQLQPSVQEASHAGEKPRRSWPWVVGVVFGAIAAWMRLRGRTLKS